MEGVGDRSQAQTGQLVSVDWYPDQELNLDPSFRKRLLYPFELSGQPTANQWFRCGFRRS